MSAMAELAGVRPDAQRPLAVMLGEVLAAAGGARVDAAHLYVVTAALSPALAERLLALRNARHEIAVVWVDAPSFAGVQSPPGAELGAALRLARASVPVARVQRDDDLSRALSAGRLREAARA